MVFIIPIKNNLSNALKKYFIINIHIYIYYIHNSYQCLSITDFLTCTYFNEHT